MRVQQSFYDPYMQRGYAPGQEIEASGEHAEWLLKHGFATGDPSAPGVSVNANTSDDPETPQNRDQSLQIASEGETIAEPTPDEPAEGSQPVPDEPAEASQPVPDEPVEASQPVPDEPASDKEPEEEEKSTRKRK